MLSKWKVFPVLSLVLCCWLGQAAAATLDYSSGGFYYQSAATANSFSDSMNGWRSVDSGSVSVDQAFPNPDNPTVRTISQSGMAFFSPLGSNYVYFGMNASIYAASSDAAGHTAGSSYITTQGQQAEPGYFLRIAPSAGEQLGASVNLSMNWSCSMDTGTLAGGTSVTGASMDAMAITVNGSSIFTHTREDLSSYGYYSDNQFISYQAQIGDIIGIFLGASGNLDYNGIGDGLTSNELLATSYQFLDMDVQSVPLPGAIWLLGGGLAGLAGLRWRLKK